MANENKGGEGLKKLREECLRLAHEHVDGFCQSFNIERANQMLPTPGNIKDAETNSLDKAFVTSLGKLEHLPSV